MHSQQTNIRALSSLVIVFFFWGFIASSNSVFIPFCKKIFQLDQFSSQLIDFAFYLAYFLGAFLIFLLLQIRKIDLVAYWGYKKSIVIGLLISALGAAVMVFGVIGFTYSGLLLGLFVLAFGFSLQQVAAQPLAISLGPPQTGAHRINLGGAVNSFGTMIGPILIGLVLFGSLLSDQKLDTANLTQMISLYGIVFLLFIVAAIFIGFNRQIPVHTNKEKNHTVATNALIVLSIIIVVTCSMFLQIFSTYTRQTDSNPQALELERFYYLLVILAVIVGGLVATAIVNKIHNQKKSSSVNKWGAMRHAQLTWGMLAIFFYVGVEVAIASNLGELLEQPLFGGYSVADTPPFISLYWGSLMIGRWAAAVEVFSFSKKKKIVLQIVLPILAFILIMLFNQGFAELGITFTDDSLQVTPKPLLGFFAFVLLFLGIFFCSKNKPRRTLLLFSSFGLAMMLAGMLSTGLIAVYAFLAGGLACSILWPAIFSLSLAKLGKDTAQGSAFLIMMILGGAVLPPIQGKLADIWGIHLSYIVPAVGFLYLLLFGYFIKTILARVNVDYDNLKET